MSNQKPIFEPVFGAAWKALPPVLKAHYANRPFSNDRVRVEGKMDVSCRMPMRLFAPIIWLLKGIPPATARDVPVTVNFESSEDSADFQFNRMFLFENRKPYQFRSRMRHIRDNEVVEMMRFGLCWRAKYLWKQDRVVLQHNGYSLHVFGCFIPVPLTLFIGRGDAAEWAVDDDTFDMSVNITHAIWGKVYEYKGRFKIVERDVHD